MADWPSSRRGVMLGAGLALAAGRASAAAAAATTATEPARSPTAARVNSGTVGVITGGIDGTYIRIAADLAAVLDDGDRLRVLPVLGKGSVQNISDLIYLRGIDVGIVQSDALTYVLQQDLFPGVLKAVSYIAKLYNEEVHILARPEITRVEDLAGKPVNVDVRGSGTAMTASIVFDKLKVPIQPTYETQGNALQQLQNGHIAALVYVTGKPASLFAGIPASAPPGAGLHFLPLPFTASLLDTYLPAQLARDAYPNLIAGEDGVDTLAVGAVMAVFAWQPGTERHAKVTRFITALSDKFARFQQPPRHPKWREVNLEAQVPGWTRFSVTPAQRGL